MSRFMYGDLSRAGPLERQGDLRWLMSFYDVWCQYCINMGLRLDDKEKFPDADEKFFKLMTERVTGGIPNMHIRNHIALCRAVYTVTHLPYTGATPTEMVETQWAETKKLGGSVKHENHGLRHDELDYMFLAYNHQKVINLREHLNAAWLAAAVSNTFPDSKISS